MLIIYLQFLLFYFTVISIGNTVIQSSPCKLPFVDILVCKKPNLVTSVYRKPAYPGLLPNFFSFKIGLVKTLFDRCYKINKRWKGFGNDVENLAKILNK